MRLLKVVGVGMVMMAASDWLFAQQREAGQKLSIEILINDLSSGDGAKRIAATKEIFRRGKDVLPDFKKEEKGFGRVLRGGSWGHSPHQCGSACRPWNEPGNRSSDFGFRLCFCLE